MAKDAVVREALARRPHLPPIEALLQAPPPRSKLVAHRSYWEPSVREGVAVKGWVFRYRADESDPHSHDYFYEVAYELEGQVHTVPHELSFDPWDRNLAGEYGDWFRKIVATCGAATVLLHPEREPVLFGDVEPYEIITLAEQLERVRRAPAEVRDAEVERAIEILQAASSEDRRGVAALLEPFAPTYTGRTHDDFYVVADLYAYARKGGDVLKILERIAPKLPTANKEYWAAE